MCESFGTGITQVVGNVKHPCSVCLKGVGVNSIRCTQCIQWVHARCSRVKDSLKNAESFICRRCKGELCETRQANSSSSSGCSHSGVATVDVFKHPHRRFGSVLCRMPSWRNLLIVGKLSQAFNMLGCTLEGNQLRHCAAKTIVQVAIIANTSGFLHQSCFDPGTNRVWVGRTTHWATGALRLGRQIVR